MSKFAAITLPRDQYRSYNLRGQTVATRKTRAHALNEAMGGGFEIVLREGDQFPDGLCVAVSITADQLYELGFVPKATISDALVDLAMAVGFDNPYEELEEEREDQPEDDTLEGLLEYIDEGDACGCYDCLSVPTNYAFCNECQKMVDPAERITPSAPPYHDISLEVFCSVAGKWIETVGGAHSIDGPCVDRRAVKSA